MILIWALDIYDAKNALEKEISNKVNENLEEGLKLILNGLVWSAEESSKQRCAVNSWTLCSGAHDSEMKIKVKAYK